MWTNEIEFDKSITTVLDETGQETDVIVTVEQDGYVFIEQYDSETEDKNNMICIPPHMFRELMEALHSPAGAFRLEER